MEDFTHDCEKTLHLIPCPLCKYYVRFAESRCTPQEQRKCYVCDICDHCKKAHNRQLQAFFDSRQQELKKQKQKEDPLKDSLGLLREFFKSLVPDPRIVPENLIEPAVQIIKSKGAQTDDDLESYYLGRFKSISEPYGPGRSRQGSKKTQSFGDVSAPTGFQKNLNEALKKTLHGGGASGTSEKDEHGNKINKSDTNLIPEKGTAKSPRHRHRHKSRSKSKSPRKSARDSYVGEFEEESDKKTKHLTSATSVPRTQKLIFNVDHGRSLLRQSKIMLNIHEGGDGVLNYALSNRKFIDNGYTKLPTIKVMRKLHRFDMKLADPELDWFARNKSKGPLKYDSGKPFAKFTGDHYQLFYRNGDLALDHYIGNKEHSVKYRTVVYDLDLCSPKDSTKKPVILATFDDMGNGIAYDSKGKVRLEYNQSEGVVYDKTLGTPARWRWHNLNEPPELNEVVVNTEITPPDAHLQKLMKKYEKLTEEKKMKKAVKEMEDERMVTLEREKLLKILSEKHKDYKQFEVQMKAVKLNDQFSLHINRQSAIVLRFQEGHMNLKFNVGLELQSDRYVDSEYVEVGNYMNPIERVPAQSDSLSSLQRVVLATRRAEGVRRRRSPPVNPAASVDRMNSLLSKPLQSPFAVTSGKCDGIHHPHVCCRCR